MSGRILIVDGVATQRIMLRARLASACFEVTLAPTGAEALLAIEARRPDLVIAAAALPDVTGTDLCRRLTDLPRGTDIPVILLTRDNDPMTRLAALEAGAEDTLAWPLDEALLMARLRSVLRARNANRELRLREDTGRALGLAESPAAFERPPRIALVSKDGRVAASLSAALRQVLDAPIEVTAREDALRSGARRAEVLVLIEEPAGRGALELLSDLLARPETRHAAILYHAPADRSRDAAAALDLGACDLLLGPLDPNEVAMRIRRQAARKRLADRQRRTVREGLRAAFTDPLTGLHNRRYALPHLARLSQAAAETGQSFAVLLADIDRFKRINDRYGHAAGDAVLAEIARRLTSNLRGADLVSRIGGEEFLLILPETDLTRARLTAERLCTRVRERPFAIGPARPAIPVSLSIGIALAVPPSPVDPTSLLASADRALYAAKAQGRNRVVSMPPSGPAVHRSQDGPTSRSA